jgi:hypothetical protein
MAKGNRDELPQVFARLRALFAPLAPPLRVQNDTPAYYGLVGLPTEKYPDGMYFGGVRLGKNYVSYYLIPVYMWPTLLDSSSERLRKRMQGKSCFNFTTLDEPLLAELVALTTVGLDRFRQEHLVE